MTTATPQDATEPDAQGAATATLTLAHVSDLHLAPIAGLSLRMLNLKRGLGFVNWQRRRKYLHLPEVAAAIMADVAGHKPDHIAVTGDLTNLGQPQEHADALAWLKGVGPPESVSVVPGNHDIYVRMGRDPGVGRWRDYMASDAWGAAACPADGPFPYARRIGPVALIGLNSSVPTPLFVQTGEIGTAQAKSLGVTLDAAARDGLVRVILIHHAPLPGQVGPRWALTDAGLMAETLARHGAELVLHGHAHREIIAELPGARPPGGWSVGVPSASAGHAHGPNPLARWHLYKISRRGPEVRIDLVVRGLATPSDGVVELSRRTLVEGRLLAGSRSAADAGQDGRP